MNIATVGIFIFLLVSAGHSIRAQEFWAMPDRFSYSPGDTMKVRLYIGNNFASEPWDVKKEKIRSVMLITETGSDDVTSRVTEGRGVHLAIPLPRPGLYSVVIETENSFAQIEAEPFNAFLKEYAIDNVVSHRKKTKTSSEPGREIYRRHCWFAVTVGDVKSGVPALPEWPVEIVPLIDPLSISTGSMVQFKVMFRDKPLFGARAFVWNNKNGKTYMQPIYTQQDGTLDVRVFGDGEWMVSVVKMIEADDVKAEWQSYWASMVFQVKE